MKILDKISLTHYLKITGRWNRIKTSLWLEKIYKDILDEHGFRYSDLVNELIEVFLRELGYLDITDYIKKEQLENLKRRNKS